MRRDSEAQGTQLNRRVLRLALCSPNGNAIQRSGATGTADSLYCAAESNTS